MTASALYAGSLTHVRHTAPGHRFSHRLYLLYLDLDELDGLGLEPVLGVERAGLLSFRRRDYFGPAEVPLKSAVLDAVERALGKRPAGPVRLLTHVRSLGPAFNPVSFYYCFAPDGSTLEAVLAEITNTPWGERYAYVVPGDGASARGEFEKAFHVSPFLSMQQQYSWRFSAPGRTLGVAMRNEERGRTSFHATLSLARRSLTRATLLGRALAEPWMSLRVLAWIYAHALTLRLKGAPVFSHPKHHPESLPERSHG